MSSERSLRAYRNQHITEIFCLFVVSIRSSLSLETTQPTGAYIKMFNRLRNFFIRNRHNIAVFTLLNTACAVCIGLVVARVAYSDSGRHLGLVWNLFLAWIPFILSYIAHAISWRRIWLFLVIPFVTILWLLFFPNAPYMLTDLQDLARTATDAPLWYDVIIVVWCSWTAMLLGVVSLISYAGYCPSHVRAVYRLGIRICDLRCEQFWSLHRSLCASELMGYFAKPNRNSHEYSRPGDRP